MIAMRRSPGILDDKKHVQACGYYEITLYFIVSCFLLQNAAACLDSVVPGVPL